MNILVREARKVVADLGYLPVGNSRLRAVVRRFIESGRSDTDFRSWFIAYADPVGEAATKRVLRERGF